MVLLPIKTESRSIHLCLLLWIAQVLFMSHCILRFGLGPTTTIVCSLAGLRHGVAANLNYLSLIQKLEESQILEFVLENKKGKIPNEMFSTLLHPFLLLGGGAGVILQLIVPLKVTLVIVILAYFYIHIVIRKKK